MRPLLRLLLLYSLTLASCVTNDEKQNSQSSSFDTRQVTDTTQQKGTKIKKAVIASDTLTIDAKSAVFYQPDSLQIKKRMKEVGEKDFRAGMDDYIYSVNTSAEYLEKQGLTVIDAKGKKFLEFIAADKKFYLIKLDTMQELWGMYLFDPTKRPYYADMTMIEDDYKNYFK